MPARWAPRPDPLARQAIRGLLIALLLASASCRRPGAGDDGARITMSVSPQPPAVGVARIDLLLADASGAPLAATAVDVEGNMTHPGMVPTRATARRVGDGRWQADLELTMGGDWVVNVEARLEDGGVVLRTLQLPGVVSR